MTQPDGPDRTTACAYSLRANPRATVSTPVTWDELTQVEPDDFDLATVPKRFAAIGDPHAAIDDAAHDISRCWSGPSGTRARRG
jgi:DNA primase